MSTKFLAFTAAGLGASAVVFVGGHYVMNKDENAQEESDLKQQKEGVEKSLSADLPFKTLKEFKSSQGGSCAQYYFGDLDYENIVESSGAENTIRTGSSSGKDPQSCLVINWDRSDSSNGTDSKWTGNFRWLWSFVYGKQGFVMFFSTKLSETAGQFDLEGGSYLLADEGTSEENQDWKIKKSKEVNGTTKHITQGDFEKSFPKVGDALIGVDASNKPHWGFVSGKGDLVSLCREGDSECSTGTTTPKSPFKEVWEWKSASSPSHTIDKWNLLLESNLSHLFGDSDKLNVSTTFANFTGSWKKTIA